MGTLSARLLTADRIDRLSADCVRLIETRVAMASGLRGVALRGGLSLLNRTKPGIIDRATLRLLPEFTRALEPFWSSYVEQAEPVADQDFSAFLLTRRDEVVQQLLSVADQRVAESRNATAKSTYRRLRRGAENELEAALPDLATLLSQHLEKP